MVAGPGRQLPGGGGQWYYYKVTVKEPEKEENWLSAIIATGQMDPGSGSSSLWALKTNVLTSSKFPFCFLHVLGEVVLKIQSSSALSWETNERFYLCLSNRGPERRARRQHTSTNPMGGFPDGPVVGTPHFQSRGPWLENSESARCEALPKIMIEKTDREEEAVWNGEIWKNSIHLVCSKPWKVKSVFYQGWQHFKTNIALFQMSSISHTKAQKDSWEKLKWYHLQKFREYMLHVSGVQSNTLLSQDYQTFMNNKLFALPPRFVFSNVFPNTTLSP